jgi:hypothetical protein
MNTKIKLNYHQLCSFSMYVTNATSNYQTPTYSRKTVLAVMIDWHIKKILPHTYLPYTKEKTITLTPAQACAFAALYINAFCGTVDNYALPKVCELINTIDSKIPKF